MGKSLKGKELGTGFRQRSDGRYEARAVINGKSICLYNKSFSKLKKEFKEKKAAVQFSESFDDETKLKDWFRKWFEVYKIPTLKETTIEPARSAFKNAINQYIGNVEIAKIKNMDVQECVNKASSDGYCYFTVQTGVSLLKSCLESAVSNGMIPFNPCSNIILPKRKPTKEKVFLTVEEEKEFLAYTKKRQPWYYEMLYVMFNTGLRIGEVGSLQWENIDFEREEIKVESTLLCQAMNGKKKKAILPPKTASSIRTIPMLRDVKKMLISQKKKTESRKEEVGKKWKPDGIVKDPVFTTSYGGIIKPNSTRVVINSITDAINKNRLKNKQDEFKPMYPHAIRHTFCSRCYEKNIDVKVVQQIMGHSKFSTTMDVYTHLSSKTYVDEIKSKF